MGSPEILNDVAKLEQAGFNKQEIAETLINKGHSDQEIIDALNNHNFKVSGSVIGIILILMAVIIGFSIQSTFGSFRYRFQSSGDFYRLNEWVLKPFLSVTLLFLGINLVRSRNNINEVVKITMITVFAIFVLVSGMSNSLFPFLFGIGGVILFCITKVPVFATPEGTALIVKSVRQRVPVEENVVKQTGGERWKGSAVFLPLFLCGVLLINSPINVQAIGPYSPYSYQEFLSQLSTLDLTLSWTLKVLVLASIVTGVFVSINLQKYRYMLVGVTILAFVHTVLALLHSNFQSSIIPSAGIALAGTFVIFSNNLLSKAKSLV